MHMLMSLLVLFPNKTTGSHSEIKVITIRLGYVRLRLGWAVTKQEGSAIGNVRVKPDMENVSSVMEMIKLSYTY